MSPLSGVLSERPVTPLAHSWGDNNNMLWIKGRSYNIEPLSPIVSVVSGDFVSFPMQLIAGLTFDQIAVKMDSTDSASGVLRFGLYYDDLAHGGPGALLKELGSFDPATGGGTFTLSVDVTVRSTGLYWIGVLAEGTRVFQGLRGGGLFQAGFTTDNYIGAAYKSTGVSTGSMPDPGFLTTTVQAFGPHVVLRIPAGDTVPMTMHPSKARSAARHVPKVGERHIQHIALDVDGAANPEVTLSANEMALIPLITQVPLALDQIALSVKTAGNNSAHVALYDSDPHNRPKNLIYSAALDVSSTGAKTATMSITIPPGLYWAAIHYKGTGTVGLTGHRCDGETIFSITAANYPGGAMKVTDTASTPSDPFDLALAWSDLNPFPRPLFRAGIGIAPAITFPTLTRGFIPAWSHLFLPGVYVGICAYPWDFVDDKKTIFISSFAALFFVDSPTRYDRVGIDSNTFTSSQDLEFAIYADKDYHPDYIIRKLGTLTVSAAGANTLAVTEFLLAPGYYWLAFSAATLGSDYNACSGYSRHQSPNADASIHVRIESSGATGLPDPWMSSITDESTGFDTWLEVSARG